MDQTISVKETVQVNENFCRVQMKNGMWISVCMIDLGEGRPDQLCVIINTEGMDANDCHDEGMPLMQIMLNDATLYDREPDTTLPREYRDDNMIGNVLSTIRDRQGGSLEEIVDKFTRAYDPDTKDFGVAEDVFWTHHGGPLVDAIEDTI